MPNPTASLINFGSVDATYPVAGQDNNSQGFRDNFGVIKTGLGQASTEITALQNNSAFKNSANDFGQNVLSNAVVKTFYGVALDKGTISTNTDISVTDGPLQSVTLTTNATLTFKNWPTSGKYAAVRLMIYSNQTAVQIPSFSTENAGVLRYDTAFPTLPGTINKGITVGGESLATVTVSQGGSGFTGATTIQFSGGGLQSGGTHATGTATYSCLSATVSGGYSGNGYKLNDQMVVNAFPGIILQVTSLNQTFTATTTNSQVNITAVSDFRNIAVGVAISGAGLQVGTTVSDYNPTGVTATGVAGTASMPANSIKMSQSAQAGATGVTITYVTADSTGPIGNLQVVSGGTLALPLGNGSYSTSSLSGTGTTQGTGARVVMQFTIGGINITSYGDGYTSNPTVGFSGGGGSGTFTVATTITALTGDNPKVIEAWTRDGGSNVYMRYIGEYN
jgi:hypothetical protein